MGTEPAQARTATEQRYAWELPVGPRRSAQDNVLDGAALAALRRGVGREAGTVPEMWPYYRELNDTGRLSDRLQAEHLTLTLFAVHQQSKPKSVHQPGASLGAAMARLRGKFSDEAVVRRFGAFATATSLGEAGTHLRGLITQLRGVDQGLDYSRLMRDLVDWQHPDRVGAVRRRWGLDFFLTKTTPTDPSYAPQPEDS